MSNDTKWTPAELSEGRARFSEILKSTGDDFEAQIREAGGAVVSFRIVVSTPYGRMRVEKTEAADA